MSPPDTTDEPPYRAYQNVVARRPVRKSRSGRGSIVARASTDGTAVTTMHADSPLRLIRPKFPGTTSGSVCVLTLGGGLVDGDEIDLDIEVEVGATLVVFTQSPTKVFRGFSRQSLSARVDGTLVLLPDPVAAFADARYEQRVDVALGANGGCVLLDGYTSGRPAYGDCWAMKSLDLRTTISHEGRTLLADALRFDSADGPIAERVGRFDAFATLVAVGRGAGPVASSILREAPAPPRAVLAVAVSALPRAQASELPGAIVRVAADRPAAALAAIRYRLRNLPDIDAVDTFGCRY
jgi:urease accessory protein